MGVATILTRSFGATKVVKVHCRRPQRLGNAQRRKQESSPVTAFREQAGSSAPGAGLWPWAHSWPPASASPETAGCTFTSETLAPRPHPASSATVLQTPPTRLTPTQPLDGHTSSLCPVLLQTVPRGFPTYRDSQLTCGSATVPLTSFLVLTIDVASPLPLLQPFDYHPMQRSPLIASPGPTPRSETSGWRVCPF